MKVVELKVQAKTLAMESKFLKMEEYKLKKQAKWARESQNKERLEKANWNRYRLYENRIKIVRPKARAINIARAFMNGLSYNNVENQIYHNNFIGIPNHFYKEIYDIIVKYNKDITIDEFLKWIYNHPNYTVSENNNPFTALRLNYTSKIRKKGKRIILTEEEREMRKLKYQQYLNDR